MLFGAERQAADARYAIDTLPKRHGGWVRWGAGLLPVYGDLLGFAEHSSGTACLSSDAGICGLRMESGATLVLRLGYDLFDETRVLLANGQPAEHANIPALDLHIELLRTWILSAGVGLVEIPPIPAGYPFVVCLTHDIDFIGIRNHLFDHSMWGFLYRSTIGCAVELRRGKVSIARLLRMWQAAASLPFVFLGWARDFWEPFEWYLQVEDGLPATYFLIPFKRHAGEHISLAGANRGPRPTTSATSATGAALTREGWEIGVHGIDAWHGADRGRSELERIANVTGSSTIGIRMHWLLADAGSARALEDAGYRTTRQTDTTRQSVIAQGPARYFVRLVPRHCWNSRCTYRMGRSSMRKDSTSQSLRLGSAATS